MGGGLILSLLLAVPAQRLEMDLIDPKKVEFAAYGRGLGGRVRVITDTDRATDRLAELVQEMESRTGQLERAKVRDLTEGRDLGRLDLPYIAVFVEELADLIMQFPEAEESLVRLAQKARATGIHLVLTSSVTTSRRFRDLEGRTPWPVHFISNAFHPSSSPCSVLVHSRLFLWKWISPPVSGNPATFICLPPPTGAVKPRFWMSWLP